MDNKKGKNKGFTKNEDATGALLYEAEMKEKMYLKMYEELNSSDDNNVDTELINECVNSLDKIMIPSERIIKPDVDAFIEGTLRKHEGIKSKQKKKATLKLLRMVAGLMIIFILSSIVAAKALNIQLWKSVVTWGEETFNMEINNNVDTNYRYEVNKPEIKEYSTIEEAATKLDINIMSPGYIPEGYTLQKVDVEKFPNVTDITGIYSNQDKLFFYHIELLSSENNMTDVSFGKDDEKVEVYEKDGINYYIMNNLKQKQVVWNVSNVLYNINGELTAEEIKKIIDSMKGSL